MKSEEKYKEKEGKRLDYKFLKDCYMEEALDTEFQPYKYLLKKKDKVYFVKRRGKCDSKVCGSICCKFMHMDRGTKERDKYSLGFYEKGKHGFILNKKCKLLKRGKCNIWQKKKFPLACKQFPHPTDATYYECMDKCTFYFTNEGELIK